MWISWSCRVDKVAEGDHGMPAVLRFRCGQDTHILWIKLWRVQVDLREGSSCRSRCPSQNCGGVLSKFW